MNSNIQRLFNIKMNLDGTDFKKLVSKSDWIWSGWLRADKDIIQKGNKEYHPDKCVFLPREINSFLKTRKNLAAYSLLVLHFI